MFIYLSHYSHHLSLSSLLCFSFLPETLYLSIYSWLSLSLHFLSLSLYPSFHLYFITLLLPQFLFLPLPLLLLVSLPLPLLLLVSLPASLLGSSVIITLLTNTHAHTRTHTHTCTHTHALTHTYTQRSADSISVVVVTILSIFHGTQSTVEGNISSRFTSKSETIASELNLKDILPRYYIQNDMLNMLKTSTTQ